MRAVFLVFCLMFLFTTCKGLKNSSKNAFSNVLSSRFYHPRGENDKESTLEAITKLNPKRIDWTYFENNRILNIYKSKKIPFSLTINPQVPDSAGYTTKKYRMINYLGKPYQAPWMKNLKQKNPYWGCVNNPEFYKLFLKKGLQLASLGAYAIQVDDAIFNYRLVLEKKIGCFCNHCINKFSKLESSNQDEILSKINDVISLKEHLKSKRKRQNTIKELEYSYHNFQIQSVINFIIKWKKAIQEKYPKLVFYTNNFNGSWHKIYQCFDGGIAELKEKYVNYKDLDSLYRLADSLGKSQLFILATERKELHYKLLEYNIKNDRESVYPWDIFISGKKSRFYVNLDSIKGKEQKFLRKYKKL